jgi:hypothetical protein
VFDPQLTGALGAAVFAQALGAKDAKAARDAATAVEATASAAE